MIFHLSTLTVPGCEHLVVQMRSGSCFSHFEQFFPTSTQRVAHALLRQTELFRRLLHSPALYQYVLILQLVMRILRMKIDIQMYCLFFTIWLVVLVFHHCFDLIVTSKFLLILSTELFRTIATFSLEQIANIDTHFWSSLIVNESLHGSQLSLWRNYSTPTSTLMDILMDWN